jgi:magnesium transporter
VSPLNEWIREREWKSLRDWYVRHGVLEIAEGIARLSDEERAVAFRMLPKERALHVFEIMDPAEQGMLLASLRDYQVSELFSHIDPDDRVRLLDELPAVVAKNLLEGLNPEERKLTSVLLGYPENSVGRIMSPKFMDLRATMTVSEAMKKIRQTGRRAETLYTIPVTDETLHLVGVVSLRDLVLALPEETVGQLMTIDVYSARADEDQERPARLIQEANLLALPVVDREGRLVGVFTVDDAMEVVELEDTEDIALGGASRPLEMPYMSVSVFGMVRHRVVWLLVLVVAAALTVNVLSHFEHALETVVALALFIPFLIDTGGNVGSQSATLVVRAMAVDEVKVTDLLKVIWRELGVGTLLGLMLGVLALVPVSFFFGFQMALVLAISLLFICTLAALAGTALPMTARRLGVDPAVVSAPIITTLVDTTGLIIYFLVAKAILNL